MRKIKTLACAFALVSLQASAATIVANVGKYEVYEVEDFTIITSRTANQAKQIIEDLAKFRVTLEKTLGKRARKNLVPTRILIVSDSVWGRFLAPRANTAGFFRARPFENLIVMNGDAVRWEAMHIVFHEYTHFYLASQFAGEYPPWFNEGLAELMSFARFDDAIATMQINAYHVIEARDRDWIPFERMIRVSHASPEYQSHELAQSFYAQSWLAVHYGMVENRDFGRQIIEYLTQLNSLRPHEEAARTAFGADLGLIDKQLREYSRSTKFSSGQISLGELPVVTLPASKPMAGPDAHAMILDLMLTGGHEPDRIRSLLRLFALREPESPRPAIFAARLAQAEDDDALYSKMIAEADARLTPTDFRARRDLAGVLLAGAIESGPLSKRSSEDNERDLKRAMRLYGEVVAHDNSDVEALWGFGTTAIRLDRNLDLAEQALLAAYERAPVSAEIATSLANLKDRQQKPDAAIPYLRDAARHANDLQTKKWATERLAELEKWVAERDRIEAENRTQREKYEKELAEYEKKYGKPKNKKPTSSSP